MWASIIVLIVVVGAIIVSGVIVVRKANKDWEKSNAEFERRREEMRSEFEKHTRGHFRREGKIGK